MENINLTVRTMKQIYLNDEPFLLDTFEEIYEIEGFLVAVNKNKLVIVNPNKEIVVSEKGLIIQVAGWGKCISIRKNNVEGIYHYDGTLLVPFEFYRVFIEDADNFIFSVKRNKEDALEPYII